MYVSGRNFARATCEPAFSRILIPSSAATDSTQTMASTAVHQQLDSGSVPNHVSNVAPAGTKFHLLAVVWLEADEGSVLHGGNTSLHDTKEIPTVNKRRALPILCPHQPPDRGSDTV